ncbi:MAG: hypothetical protein K9L89_03420 [Kiritimatiellales bacterium]|nr:hypothetical protein [Kiritimatiellales bacterium]
MIYFRILLGILGMVILGYGIRCIHKDHYKSALGCFGLSAIFLLTDPTSFQGFLKTGIIAKLNSLGRTVDRIQDTLVEQQESLKDHQAEIKSHQQELSEQQIRIASAQSTIQTQQLQVLDQQTKLDSQETQLRNMQMDLIGTQERISKQQSQIEDVEFLVQNFFSKTRTEQFRASDTNRFVHVKHGNGAFFLCFLLEEPAVINSINGYYDNIPMKPIRSNFSNVMYTIMIGKWNEIKELEYNIRYVADTRDIQKYSKMEVIDGKIYLDGKLLLLNYDHEESNKKLDPPVKTPAEPDNEQDTAGQL